MTINFREILARERGAVGRRGEGRRGRGVGDRNNACKVTVIKIAKVGGRARKKREEIENEVERRRENDLAKRKRKKG